MAIESDKSESEKLSQVDTSDGANNNDSATTDNPDTTQNAPSFGGQLLRFAGMTIIVAVILLALFFLQEPAVLIGLLVVGSVGAAMHYKGRKLAPGKPGASILGGILGGVASSAALIIAMLFVAAMFLDACKAFFKL